MGLVDVVVVNDFGLWVWVLGGVADFILFLFFKFSDGGYVALVFWGVVANGSLGF